MQLEAPDTEKYPTGQDAQALHPAADKALGAHIVGLEDPIKQKYPAVQAYMIPPVEL
jgi:hypothetical protein